MSTGMGNSAPAYSGRPTSGFGAAPPSSSMSTGMGNSTPRPAPGNMAGQMGNAHSGGNMAGQAGASPRYSGGGLAGQSMTGAHPSTASPGGGRPAPAPVQSSSGARRGSTSKKK
jgi:hypothetical protein